VSCYCSFSIFTYIILMWSLIRLRKKCAQLTQGWCCLNECLSEYIVCPAGVRRMSSVAAHGLGLRVSILLGVRLYLHTVVCSVVFCTYRQGWGPFLGPWSSATYQNKLMFQNSELKLVTVSNPMTAEEKKIRASNTKIYSRGMNITLESRHLQTVVVRFPLCTCRHITLGSTCDPHVTYDYMQRCWSLCSFVEFIYEYVEEWRDVALTPSFWHWPGQEIVLAVCRYFR